MSFNLPKVRYKLLLLIAAAGVLTVVFVLALRGAIYFPRSIGMPGVELRLYSLFVMLAIVVGVLLYEKLKNLSNEAKLRAMDVWQAALYVLIPGIIGARLYHVVTDYYLYQDNLISALAIWNGGLGIIGGIVGGLFGAAVYFRVSGVPAAPALALLAIVMPVAQAVGRLGNFFNKELFGLPTDLPWGVFVRPEDNPFFYLRAYEYFHPLFLYEALFNLALAAGLYLLYKRGAHGTTLVIMYLTGYGAMRYILDFIRVDGREGIGWLTYAQIIILAWLVFALVFGVAYQVWHKQKYGKWFTTKSPANLSKKLRVLFIGTGDFAIKPLEKICQLANGNAGIELVGLVTQPDQPVGRKQQISPGPLKAYIQEHNPDLLSGSLPLYQPEKLKLDAQYILNETRPDLVIVAAYGQMIPPVMLQQPVFGAWNLHGSLLPELRGAVPVQMAILQGLAKTGVSIQQMVTELDAGDIILQEELQILPQDTTQSLMDRLSQLAAGMLPAALESLQDGSIEFIPQDNTRATFCYQRDIAKEQAQIHPETTVDQALRMVRAFNPWPVAWLELQFGAHKGKKLKVYSARPVEQSTHNQQEVANGALLALEGRLVLRLDGGGVELIEVQLEGKTRQPAANYLYLAK